MQTFYPVLRYEEARAAMDFLERAFGFEIHASHDGESGDVMHAELRLGDQYVMLGSISEGEGRFNRGAGRQSIYVAVDDPDALHDRAKQAGAKIERELTEQDYGSREFTASDQEGNVWSFGTYRPSG